MFVAVTCEFSIDDHRGAVFELLRQYGFKQMLKDVFESTAIREESLSRMKRDIDRITDSYDVVRIYQYPVDGTLAISALKEKKWRRFKVQV